MEPNLYGMDHTPTKRKKTENTQDSAQLDVLGISRSGRIRKKSSKLMDFESPDDIDTKIKRQLPPPKSYPPSYRQQADSEMMQGPQEYHQEGNPQQQDTASGSDSDDYENGPGNDERAESGSNTSEDWSDTDRPQSTPSSSLYIMEKAHKKKLAVKDGRISSKAKAQRKDKGKSRVTAYMLWSKGAREELLRNCPDMDFSAVSKRLGEMWANVNFQERYVWKRKARRYAMEKDQLENQSYTKIISNAAPVKVSNPVGRPPKNPKPQPPPVATSTPLPVTQSAQQVSNVNGCGPVQVAAHLRLLGESLAIIGERLKEHEGQIAVSGSVSVLLDTVLCSLAPLLCITRAIPAIAPPQELLKDTLHNIAYIMPGL